MFLLLLVLLLTSFTTSVTFAAQERGSNCPTGFTLEMAMDHDDHEHSHVGTLADQNDDGFICVKPVTPDETTHVHIDNNVP